MGETRESRSSRYGRLIVAALLAVLAPLELLIHGCDNGVVVPDASVPNAGGAGGGAGGGGDSGGQAGGSAGQAGMAGAEGGGQGGVTSTGGGGATSAGGAGGIGGVPGGEGGHGGSATGGVGGAMSSGGGTSGKGGAGGPPGQAGRGGRQPGCVMGTGGGDPVAGTCCTETRQTICSADKKTLLRCAFTFPMPPYVTVWVAQSCSNVCVPSSDGGDGTNECQ